MSAPTFVCALIFFQHEWLARSGVSWNSIIIWATLRVRLLLSRSVVTCSRWKNDPRNTHHSPFLFVCMVLRWWKLNGYIQTTTWIHVLPYVSWINDTWQPLSRGSFVNLIHDARQRSAANEVFPIGIQYFSDSTLNGTFVKLIHDDRLRLSTNKGIAYGD